MHRRLIGATLSLALIALISFGNVLAQKDPNNKGAVPKDSDTLTAKDYTGVLKTTFNSDRTFTMTIENKTMVPLRSRMGARPPVIPGGGRSISNLNNAINRIYTAQAAYVKALASAQKPSGGGKKAAKGASAASQRKVQTAAQNLQNALANYQNAAAVAGVVGAQALTIGANGVPNFRFDVTKQDYDFQHTETVKVRIMELPEQFDEKGNPKPYTEQEKKDLKGKDKDLPGYEAQPDKLEAGQKVRVTLISVPKKKPADNDKDKAKDANKDKDGDKDKDTDKDGEKKMQVKLVVILEQAPDKTKTKKKKDQ